MSEMLFEGDVLEGKGQQSYILTAGAELAQKEKENKSFTCKCNWSKDAV